MIKEDYLDEARRKCIRREFDHTRQVAGPVAVKVVDPLDDSIRRFHTGV